MSQENYFVLSEIEIKNFKLIQQTMKETIPHLEKAIERYPIKVGADVRNVEKLANLINTYEETIRLVNLMLEENAINEDLIAQIAVALEEYKAGK